MDYSNPVCRRTRSKTEEFFRSLSKPRRRETTPTEVQIKVENEDFGNDSVAVFVDKENNLGFGFESRKVGSQSQSQSQANNSMGMNGTRDNPLCIDEDDEDEDLMNNIDEDKCSSDSEFLLSSEDFDHDDDDSEDSSDCSYDIYEDREERHCRKRRDFEMNGVGGESCSGVWRKSGSGKTNGGFFRKRYGEFTGVRESSDRFGGGEFSGRKEKGPSPEIWVNGGVDDEGNVGEPAQKRFSQAKRARLVSHSKSNRVIVKDGDGTASQPFCIDQDNDDGGVGAGELEFELEEGNQEPELFTDELFTDQIEKVVRKRLKSDKTREKKLDVKLDVARILLDSITEGTALQDPNEIETQDDDNLRPNEERICRKFFFGEETKQVEKSAEELELEKLWDEMNLAVAAGEIGSLPVDDMVEDEDEDVLSSERDVESLCNHGRHQLIYDEQIGYVCSRCLHVQVEIQHIMPPFERNPWGQSEFRDLGFKNSSVFDKLGEQDYNCGSLSGNGFPEHADTVWDFIPGIKDTMYPHQQEGFEFIWTKIAGGIRADDLKGRNMESSSEEGCIISHAPGTGKTRLTIVFLQSYLKLYPMCFPVIIAPCSMLLTWEEEFRKWKVDIPFHNYNSTDLSGKEDEVAARLLLRGGVRHDPEAVRAVKLRSWAKGGAILGITYSLFAQRVRRANDDKAKQSAKILVDRPNLVVLDEGHTPRNDQTRMWKALSRLKTRKRIVLSGTVFQNNLSELYNTFCLVMPRFEEGEPSTMDNRDKEAKKAWNALTKSVERMEYVSPELRALVQSYAHVHEGNVLDSLPGFKVSMVILEPSTLQKNLLKVIHERRKNQFEFEFGVSMVSVHPSLFLKIKFEALTAPTTDKDELKRLRLNYHAGVKTKFLVELIRLCESINEKVLVFSQYISPLRLVKKQLESHFSWSEKAEISYIDGKMDFKLRQSIINVFNNPSSNVRVLLASLRTCSEGINLVGASRVVLLDIHWNPSVEWQAISRAYRIGQKKIVYIYRLFTHGTMEREKYSRQDEKHKMSKLVFSKSSCHSNPPKTKVREDRILEEMVQHEKLKDMFVDIVSEREK
ncbi:hypothetical protein CsatB_004404 [Cannabis sativa]